MANCNGGTRARLQRTFFDHDMMIMGPSHLGDALSNRYARGSANSPERQVHSFAHTPKQGDRILMRFAHDVIGIGQVPPGDEYQYSFNEAFKCIYGWDLCHCRRVIWAENYELGGLASVYQNAKQKPTFTQVHEQSIVRIVRDIDNAYFERSPKEMPEIDASIYSDEELGVELFRAGISNKNIASVLFVSVRTVKAHLTNIFNKMGVGSRTEAITKALRKGYISLDDITEDRE